MHIRQNLPEKVTSMSFDKYKISPNFFAFKKSFRQLLLWVIHTDEIYGIANTKQTRESVKDPTELHTNTLSMWTSERLIKNLVHKAFDYVYIRGGQMRGLRQRTAKEFGHMVSKLQKRSTNRIQLLEQAIRENQNWNLKFHLAQKSKRIFHCTSCSSSKESFTKTLADAYSFCEKCEFFVYPIFLQ